MYFYFTYTAPRVGKYPRPQRVTFFSKKKSTELLSVNQNSNERDTMAKSSPFAKFCKYQFFFVMPPMGFDPNSLLKCDTNLDVFAVSKLRRLVDVSIRCLRDVIKVI